MTIPFLPGTPAPSDHLVKAASLLAEIEWRERFGFDTGDLEEELAAVIEDYTFVKVWVRKDLCGND